MKGGQAHTPSGREGRSRKQKPSASGEAKLTGVLALHHNTSGASAEGLIQVAIKACLTTHALGHARHI